MNSALKINIITFLLITSIATIYALPNFAKNNFKYLPRGNINLGLDLKGGSHLLLNIDFNKYIDDVYQSLSDRVRKYLRSNKIHYKDLEISKNNIQFKLLSSIDSIKIPKLVKNLDSSLVYSIKNSIVTLSYNEYMITQLKDKVLNQSIEIIRMRIDSLGTKEPNIQRQGAQYILVQIPGNLNPVELKRILGKTAKLSIHLVDKGYNSKKDDTKHHYMSTNSHMVQSEATGEVLIVKKHIIISGDQLNNAQVHFQDGKPVVHFSMNHYGAQKFAHFTASNQGKRIAIILDNKILSAPIINQPIIGGEGIISGNFTIEQATDLALMLRTGALPASLEVIEERVIGPNLGADSIKDGKIAALVGFILVVIFMLLFYGTLGLFASITLAISLLYITALLSLFHATLTLPGIAGIILTIGMAVDSNVLIYERIREESLKGYSNIHAAKIGFESAIVTITDSNVTTLIVAFLLYIFGIGAIKGFAITLAIGIIVSMYTALVVTKIMVYIWITYYNPKSLGLK